MQNFYKSQISRGISFSCILFFYFLVFFLLTNCQNNKENSQNLKCQHCGMPTQKYPKWHAKMVYDEGIKWACSPRCMLLITKGHKPTDKKQPTKIWVKEYYTLKEIDAKKAYYVSKSDVLGPMGADFIPLETQTSALDFIKEHCKEVKKDNLWTFEDINLSIIQDALR